MGAVHVDHNAVWVQCVVELRVEVIRRGKEQLTIHHVGSSFLSVQDLHRPFHRHEMSHTPRKQDHGHQHTYPDANGQVVRGDGDDHGGNHDCGFALGHHLQGGRADAVPVERGNGYEDHHRNQSGHRDQRNHITQNHHEDQQEEACQECGDAGPPAGGLHIDHGLADHRAAAHAAKEPRDNVCHALAPGFTSLGGTCIGDVVNKLRRHQGFQQPHKRHGQGEGEDDLQGFQVERHIRQHQRRQGFRQRSLVPHRGNNDCSENSNQRQHHNGHQRCRNGLCQPRQAENDQQTNGRQRVNKPRHTEQFRHLGHENQDGQGVDESNHDRAWNEPHQLGHSKQAQHHLEDTGQNDGRNQVIQAVALHQRGDDQRNGPGGSRNHRRPPSHKGNRHGHGERGKQTDPRIHPGNDRKRDGLRDQGQCNHEPRQDLRLEPARGLQSTPNGLQLLGG